MEKLELRLIVPILDPISDRFSDRYSQDVVERSLDDIQELIALIDFWKEVDYYQEFELETFRYSSLSDISHSIDITFPSTLRGAYTFFEVKLSVSYYRDKLPFPEGVIIKLLPMELVNQINNVILIANIACPAIVSTGETYFLFEKELVYIGEGVYAEDLEFALDAAEKFAWPTIEKLSILSAWNWVQQFKGFRHSFGEEQVSRALAAFSNIIAPASTDNNFTQIMWAIMALEALYGKSNINLKSQIMEKSEIFLGSRASHKKVFGKMYDFRSRFIHGDLNFPFHYNKNEGTEGYQQFEGDLWQYKDIAVSIVIATLQKMIVMNLSSLDFVYELKSL